jgi:tetratricopeptide (TPR) repeat protein
MSARARERHRGSPNHPRTRAPRSWAAAFGASWPPLLLIALTVVTFAPALNGQFLWDDDAHVTRPELRSVAGLVRIWFEPGATQQYYPLLHTAFWIQQHLWGDAVFGYHLVSLLLHATSAVLLWLILRRLEVGGAWLAAAVFAVHPLQVESVAWISEQKNTLSLTFYLTSFLLYLDFDRDRRRSRYLLALVFFVLGLLTKTIVATLPGVLLVIFWWQRGRLSWRRDVAPLSPWFVAGAVAGLATAAIERSMLGAEGAAFNWTLGERAVLAGRAAWFYLAKLVWPSQLLFVYPRWDVTTAWPWPLAPLGAAAVVVGCFMVRARWRAPLAVALIYVGTLFPALGFVNVYPFVFSFVADHFAYVPSIAIIVAASSMFSRSRFLAGRPWLRRSAAAVVIAVLGVLAWRQSTVYADAETLYRSTLEGNPSCYLCLNNLGTLAVARGDTDVAIEQFEAALRVQPQAAETHNNLANLLMERGDTSQAIEHYRRSLAIAPRNVVARTNLGIALTRMGRLQDARAEFEEALRVMPNYAPAAHNLEVLKQAGVGNRD